MWHLCQLQIAKYDEEGKVVIVAKGQDFQASNLHY
jgi:hypothetical protein